MADKINALIEEIKTLTLLEVAELVKNLEEEFGVSAAAAVAVAAPAADGAADGGKSEFDVILVDAGASKMPVIKLIKDITGLGLKESKELVDSAPSTVKEALSADAAEELKKQLEEAGAKIELK